MIVGDDTILTATTLYLAALAGGYLLGSIPFGLLLTKFAGLGDIRQSGSGNIGATNVLRTGKKSLAAATLLLDMLKGFIPVFLVQQVSFLPTAPFLAGAAALIGHVFPVWLLFRGGKGVATYIGVLWALAWPLGLAFCLIWLATALITRISSLSALVASALIPIVPLLPGSFIPSLLIEFDLVRFLAFMSLVIFFTHRKNIARLLRGEESRIGE